MTQTVLPLDGVAPAGPSTPRPGSRADRMRMPMANNVLRDVAESFGVCVRPLAIRRTDTHTGVTEVIDVPCGARLASQCKPCAERNRRLRIQQIREGWHLAEEPTPAPERPADDVVALVSTRAHLEFDRAQLMTEKMTPEERQAELAAIDEAITEVDQDLAGCRVRGRLVACRDGKKPLSRSTRRRADAAELPRLPVADRTVGRTFAAKDGRTFRPSTLLTVTLGSHGKVHTGARTRRGRLVPCECGTLHGQRDPLLGTPLDPQSYDYRQAAIDAIHFAALLDRFWQNLRRAVGWKVQYAGAVELQKRLAPHAHFAVRGTMPRKLMHQVAAATYHQVWWPPFDTMRFNVEQPPIWDTDKRSYVDPKTGEPLLAWAEAIKATTEEEAEPACVVRLGKVDPRGIEHGTRDAERSIRYVTKYLTKDLVEHAPVGSEEQQAHFDRLRSELAVLPCSPRCANWLLYGVQPDKAKPGLVPGRCTGKVHQERTLGFTGRRVLISRQWSGKTLADHRADQRDWIRTVLSGALADDEQQSADTGSRYTFELAKPDDPDVPSVRVRILRSIAERQRWKAQLQQLRDDPPTVSANEINNGEEGNE
ncbi:replication initiator [Allorhizocola rhizosphaerae]|uniref:replication initiator n=1 Tax=Allorhizocola rhizosphaerae TaxID=1872709 RepID=UPI000E3EB685|nr:replication initiator [Allorhizocola rhizosphaerae]